VGSEMKKFPLMVSFLCVLSILLLGVVVVNAQSPITVSIWKDAHRGALSVSVDDGYTSCSSQLTANGFEGTYFYDGTSPYSSWGNLYNAGMELGSHTANHPCNAIDDNSLRYQEIEPNIDAICAGTPQPCNYLISMAWPCGYTNSTEETVALDYFLSARGYNHNQLEEPTPSDFMNLKSFNSHVHKPYPPDDFKTIVDAAEQTGKWANLVFHSTCDDDNAISYAASKDIWVAPIGRIIKYILQRDGFILENYNESSSGIGFTYSRLALASSPDFNFESAFSPADTVTLKIDIDDSRTIESVRLNDKACPYNVLGINGNKFLLINAPVLITSQSVYIGYQGGQSPAISVSPSSLQVNAVAGTNPANETIVVSNAGGGTLSYTIADDASWLSCSPVSGTSTGELDTIAVSYSTSGLAVGTYTATISITASGASNSPQTVPVTLTVNPFAVGTGHYDFTYVDRASLLAAGWDFNAVQASGAIRNTEQTTGAVVSYDQVAHPGVLRIPVDVGDLWVGVNNTRNTLFRDLPSNWTSIRLKLSFTPTQNYQQAGLVAYQDDDNYVQVTRIFENGSYVTFAREVQRGASIISEVKQTATQGLVLRLDRELATEKLTGYYSLDGVSWVSLGSVTQALNNPSLGIVVGASPGGYPNADMVWAEIVQSP
jgi:regulation of enolase protein 1 (concanavalin A-like superfamily)